MTFPRTRSQLAIRRASYPLAATQTKQGEQDLKHQESLVSVITPVYNGAAYLRECIESVLAQSYETFEYFIIDNCSTDESFEIAQEAAAADDRVNVVRSNLHVGPIQNWNRSLASVGDKSAYIKFVHADDWLFPDCLTRMVDVADNNQNVGLVSAYRLEENRVSLDHLPADAPLVPGKDTFTMDGVAVARAILRDKASVLGSPTAILIRSSLLRGDEPFFDEDFLHADKEACLRLLQSCEFGFVRQVLTYTRRHNESVTSKTTMLDTRRQENLLLLKKYGPNLLPESEFASTLARELRGYYDFLARNVGIGMGKEFWASHRDLLVAAGSPYRRSTLINAFVRRWANPASSIKEYFRDKAQRDSRHGGEATQYVSSIRPDSQSNQD
jgi:glycosyltransferase involved in cell wall biosynthesis